MTWLLALGQRLLGLAPVRWAAAALAALVAVLAALGAARRSGGREGRNEVEAEQGRETIEAVRRRDEATREPLDQRPISALRRLTSPGTSLPPALVQRSSSAGTAS